MTPGPILFVDDERQWRGGQDSLFNLLEGLDDRGVSFSLAVRKGGGLAERLLEKNWPVSVWKPGGEFSPGGIFYFRRLVRELKPGIIYYNTPRTICSGVVGSRLAGASVVHMAARRVDFPLGRNVFSRLKYRYGVDYIVAISQAVKQTLITCGVPEEKIILIHPGVSLADFDGVPPASSEFPRMEGTSFFTLSALTEEKGLDILIRAFHRHHDHYPFSRLLIAGKGKLEEELREEANRNGIESFVRFLGFRTDPVAVMKCMDVLVAPSLFEGFGRAVLYAMAAGLPVVGSRVGGIVDQVVDGEKGILVPPGDEDALARAMDRVAGNRAAARLMGEKGRSRIKKYFTRDHTVEKYIHIFQKVLANSDEVVE